MPWRWSLRPERTYKTICKRPLGRGQRSRNSVPLPDRFLTLTSRRVLRGRECQPHVSLPTILRHAESLVVHQAEAVLGQRESLLGGRDAVAAAGVEGRGGLPTPGDAGMTPRLRAAPAV
jgi:hypothetical protein